VNEEGQVSEQHELAVVELLGAMTYGQLRTFEVTSRAVRFAPDARRADRVSDFAAREHQGYVLLRDTLTGRTELASALIDRQRPRWDAYFDAMPLDDWLGTVTFFAVGLPIAADFARAIAPSLDDDLARVVVGALADRGAFEAFARDEVAAALEGDDEQRERVRHLVADILGKALTGFQGAMSDTNALRVLFAEQAEREGVEPEAVVKRIAIDVMSGHRRRMVALDLEDLA
jgi:CBS domain-containing protein